MGKRQTRKEREDAAYLASIQHLPDQITLNGTLDGGGIEDALPRLSTVPEPCPACRRAQTYDAGWTRMRDGRLQCGGCGHIIMVDSTVDQAFAQKLNEHARRLTNKSAGIRRDRGAR